MDNQLVIHAYQTIFGANCLSMQDVSVCAGGTDYYEIFYILVVGYLIFVVFYLIARFFHFVGYSLCRSIEKQMEK